MIQDNRYPPDFNWNYLMGIALFCVAVLQVAFIVLKLVQVLGWSWLIVMSPLISTVLLVILIIVLTHILIVSITTK